MIPQRAVLPSVLTFSSGSTMRQQTRAFSQIGQEAENQGKTWHRAGNPKRQKTGRELFRSQNARSLSQALLASPPEKRVNDFAEDGVIGSE
jgi:hypothetical protein